MATQTMTTTTTTTTTTTQPSLETSASLPPVLPNSILAHFPTKLSVAQAGHLRHFHNLATLPDGEWRHMGCIDPGQESFEAYRYQLATMAYAAAVTHYHRLPALRGPFRALSHHLLHKMLRRDVWGYWFLTSQSGTRLDPSLAQLRTPWPDPVCRENIMYSGHLLLMASLHGMLFDDDAYEKPGALTFDWNPMFFGLGAEKFAYDRATLQAAILAEMERSGWMGVCCEPNAVFVICNQFPIIAMRYNDVRDGTSVVEDVLDKYRAAWAKKNGGFTAPSALGGQEEFVFFWMVKQDTIVANRTGLGTNAWASAFMNAWNADFVHAMFPKLVRGYLTKFPDGRISINDLYVSHEIRQGDGGSQADDDALTVTPEAMTEAFAKVQTAVAERRIQTPMGVLAQATDFGYAMQWISEVAQDDSIITGLLKHADAYLNPSWEKGGLYYPRRDGAAHDDQGNWIAVDPYSGNAAIAYGRLNVQDGQRKMWEQPWTRDGHHATYPVVEGVTLSNNVDFLRGEWNEDVGALVLTMKTWHGGNERLDLKVQKLSPGLYGVYQDSQLVHSQIIATGDAVDLSVDVGHDEVDVVILKQKSPI